jgi:hypothetical protein
VTENDPLLGREVCYSLLSDLMQDRSGPVVDLLREEVRWPD